LRHGLRHANHYVSECKPFETLLGGKSADAVSIVQTGEGAANRQKSLHMSVLTAISFLRITIRLNRLKVEYTFLRGCAKNPRLQMLGDLIAVVKGLASVFTWKRQLDDEKLKNFASLCDEISTVLEQFSKMSEDRRQSIYLCAELREYVKPIRDVAGGTLASDEISRLATKLDRVCDAWEHLASSAEPGSYSYEGYIDQLVEGAGQFRGLANRLRAT